MKTEDFDYKLDEELIAQTPLKDRSSSRLLVLDKKTKTYEDKTFLDIIDYLNEGDTLVINNTKVDMNNLKLNAINELELKQKNLCLLNVLLGKAGCIKQIDPNKLAKGLFSINLEFLQYLFDFIYKKFGEVIPKKRYRGLKRRIEILIILIILKMKKM